MTNEQEPKRIAPYPLPRVTFETAETVRGNALERGQAYLDEAEARLWEENPGLIHIMGQYVTLMGVKDPATVSLTRQLLVIAHDLLVKQGEADALEKMQNPA